MSDDKLDETLKILLGNLSKEEFLDIFWGPILPLDISKEQSNELGVSMRNLEKRRGQIK